MTIAEEQDTKEEYDIKEELLDRCGLDPQDLKEEIDMDEELFSPVKLEEEPVKLEEESVKSGGQEEQEVEEDNVPITEQAFFLSCNSSIKEEDYFPLW